jgi:hypothetical protein
MEREAQKIFGLTSSGKTTADKQIKIDKDKKSDEGMSNDKESHDSEEKKRQISIHQWKLIDDSNLE